MFLWFFFLAPLFSVAKILVLAEITLYYRWSGGHSSAAHRAQLTKRFAMVGTLLLAICKQPICGIGIQQNSPRRHHVPSGEVFKLKTHIEKPALPIKLLGNIRMSVSHTLWRNGDIPFWPKTKP